MTRRFAVQVGVENGTRSASKPGTVLGIPGTWTSLGVELSPDTTFAEWEEIGQLLQTRAKAILWLIGDWYLFGEDHFGEDAAQAIGDDTGYSARTVQQAAWVSSRFPISSRLESVPWSTHMALASVEDESKRVRLLELAANERWTREQAREQVRGLKQISGPPGVPAIAQEKGRSVNVGEFLLTLFAAKGLLIVQRRDRHTGMVLDRALFTDEALVLMQDFLDGGAG
jgi:hypothetical protein